MGIKGEFIYQVLVKNVTVKFKSWLSSALNAYHIYQVNNLMIVAILLPDKLIILFKEKSEIIRISVKKPDISRYV
jgi:hypothetical protein